MKLDIKAGYCSKDLPLHVGALPERRPDDQHSAAGIAALGICESLLLALIDLKIMSATAAHNLLSDVITTHTWAAELSAESAPHQAAAEAAQRILNSVIVGNVVE
jgi:hypothetical protein